MNTHDLDSAFKIIKQYDPATYARMESSGWHASTSTRVLAGITAEQAADLRWVIRPYGATEANLSAASGIPGNPPETWINLPQVTRWSYSNGVPVAYFLADVLVHEFRHTSQDGADNPALEVPAFAAGTAFADKLPAQYGRPIAQLSRATAGAVASGRI